jgi:hypothetical protein
MRIVFSIFSFLFTQLMFSQLPETDIWLFKLGEEKMQIVIKSGKNITNRAGYDNQPSFSADGKRVFYTSILEDKQADVFGYYIKGRKVYQVTKSPESEYSVVENRKNELSLLMVEKDSTQRIHIISSISPVIPEKIIAADSIGYYTFLNEDSVVYYKLTNPHSLRIFSMKTGDDKFLGNHPIRGFKAINRHALIYGLKDSIKVVFYKYDFTLHKAERFAEYNSLNEDIIWHEKWGLIKSEGTQLLRFDEVKNEWKLLFDLSRFGIKKITRFNFDTKNKYLVVVDNL